MKIQDVVFFSIVVILFFIKRKPQWFVTAGIFCLLLAIPLFAKWIFFTAERLTLYAAGFFVMALLLLSYRLIKK